MTGMTYQVPVENLLDKIAESSELTALNTALGSFDWFSMLIAFVALLVSVFSLYYAIVTLKVSRDALDSQERTERNTRRVSFETQSILLAALRQDAFLKFADLCAMNIQMHKYEYTCYPDKKHINNLRFSLSYIQEDSDNKDDNFIYLQLAFLKEKISDYNVMLNAYERILSDYHSSSEIKINTMNSMMEDVMDIADTINFFFRSYYSGTPGDSLDQIFSLNARDVASCPSYPIDHNFNLNHSNLRRYCSDFINDMLDGKEYIHNGEPVTAESLKRHLMEVTAYCLTFVYKKFYNFDLDLTPSRPYISTWVGLLLPVPSMNVAGKYNFGYAEIYIYKGELRLFSANELRAPSITFVKRGGESVAFELSPVKDKEKNIYTVFYAVECERFASVIENRSEYEQCIIQYEPWSMPSILASEEHAEDKYRLTIPFKNFHDELYAMRIEDRHDRIYDSPLTRPKRTSSKGTSDFDYCKSFEILSNDKGETLLIIGVTDAELVNPRLVVGYDNEAILCINENCRKILTNVSDAAIDGIRKCNSIRVVEADDDHEVIRDYHAIVIVVKNIHDVFLY